MFEMIVLAVVALAGIAGLLLAIIAQGRTILRFGNQLAANSDFQVRRIELETTGSAQAQAAEEYKRRMAEWSEQAERAKLPLDIPGA